jgi:isopenicillin N synthase-like dioxygenase
MQFIAESHSIGITILENLSNALGLKGDERYEHQHGADSPSTSTAVLQHYPSEVDLPRNTSAGHFTHTDTGSITILFNTNWGLQVCSPDGDRWEYVPPSKNDLAIVNIGDALKFLSGLTLKSCLHRVVPCFGKWEAGPRYATIFFLRPNNNAEFTDTEGKRWKAEDWLNRKFLNYRSPHSDQERNAIATGRKGFVGLWEKPETASLAATMT